MIAALILNLAIVLTIIVGLVVTHNPLFLLGLLMLREMPVFAPKYLVDAQVGAAQDTSKPIGFTADIE